MRGVFALLFFTVAEATVKTSKIPTTLTACVFNEPPFAICNTTTREVLGGFSVSVWNRIVELEGLKTNYICRVHQPNMEVDMANGACDVGLGISATRDLLSAGWTFSQPTVRTGWAILTRRFSGDTKNIALNADAFKFMTLFDYSLWTAILVTMFFNAILFAIFEGFNQNTEEFPREPIRGLWEGMWSASSTMITMGTDKPITTVPARFLQLIWQFMILIIVSSYTANLASELTASSLTSTINGPEDLVGQAVLADTKYESGLKDLGAIPQVRDIQTEDVLLQMIQDLKNHVAVAIVTDRAIASYYAKSDCTLTVVPGDWKTEYSVMGFPANTSFEFESMVSDGLLQMRENGDLSQIKADTISSDTDPCSTSATNTDSFSWFDLRGLWYVYFFALAAIVVCVVCVKLARANATFKSTLTFLSPQGIPEEEGGEEGAENTTDKVLYDINSSNLSGDQSSKLLYSVLVELRELRSTVERQQAQITYLVDKQRERGGGGAAAQGGGAGFVTASVGNARFFDPTLDGAGNGMYDGASHGTNSKSITPPPMRLY